MAMSDMDVGWVHPWVGLGFKKLTHVHVWAMYTVVQKNFIVIHFIVSTDVDQLLRCTVYGVNL